MRGFAGKPVKKTGYEVTSQGTKKWQGSKPRFTYTTTKQPPKTVRGEHGITYELVKKMLDNYGRKILTKERTLNRSHINRERTLKMIDEHYSNKFDYREEVSRLLTFEMFCREFID